MCNPSERLKNDEDICHQAHNPMGRRKSRVVTFVDFNDNECRNETKDTQNIKEEMNVSPQNFMFRGRGWLQNQNGLNLNQNPSRVQELCKYQHPR